MRASILAGLLAAGSAQVSAFSDSSPFLLFSTSALPAVAAPDQLQSSERVLASAKALLADCPTTRYLLVAQPNVHASDLYAPPACEAHRLRRALAASAVQSRFAVSEVVSVTAPGAATANNNLTLDGLAAHVRAACAAARGVDAAAALVVDELALPALPPAPTCQGRAEAMADNDYVLGNALDDALALGDVTVVYVGSSGISGSSATHAAYEAAFDNPAQVHVKKRIAELHAHAHAPRAARDATAGRDTRGVFEKYQFFTPGIFMGLLAFSIILSILYVGLSAVASLQVPYGAFNKEMGPTAQKKQQ